MICYWFRSRNGKRLVFQKPSKIISPRGGESVLKYMTYMGTKRQNAENVHTTTRP